MSLTERQKRFVRAYRECGNATEAARRAGYTGTDVSLRVTGSRLLTHAGVAAELKKAEEKAERASVASVDELHEFWSKVMRGEAGDGEEPPRWSDRLKASELRAKAAGVFVEKREVSGPGGGPVQHEVTSKYAAMSDAELAAKAEEAARLLRGGK